MTGTGTGTGTCSAWPAILAAGLLAALGACGGPDVTRPRLEAAVAGTFGQLYVQQQALLGHPGLSPAAVNTAASCDRGGPAKPDIGPGDDWACTVVWNEAGGHPRTAVYELSVRAEACYRADGPPAIVGQQQLPLPDGSTAINPVYAFDGCFRT